MNLFHFLKSTKGAIKPLNALAISGVATVGAAFLFSTAANHQIAQRNVRSLSSLQAEQNMGDSFRFVRNAQEGRVGIANREERAAMENNGENSAIARYNRNQAALENMQSSLGRAAAFSDSDGLSADADYDVSHTTGFMVGNPNAPVSGKTVAGSYEAGTTGATVGQGGGNGGQNQLAQASMTRASGSNLNASASPVGGSSSRASGAINGERADRLSGSMPGGSNIVTRMGLDGAVARGSSSSFGQNRSGRVGRGHRVGAERDELKDILKKSAAADANVNASANEGGRAFFDNSKTSGGVTVEGSGEKEGTVTSPDLASPTDKKLNAIGQRLTDEENKQKKRDEAHKRLIASLIWKTLLSAALIFAASKILSKMDKKTFWYWAVAAGFLGGVIYLSGTLFAEAKNFIADYGNMGGTFVASLTQFVAPLLVGAMIQTVLQPNWKEFFKNMMNNLSGSFAQLGMGLFK